MPISELRQTVRNLSFSAQSLRILVSSNNYVSDAAPIYDQLCSVLDDLNKKLEALEGEGETVEWEKFDEAA